jgi:hypothetical protein
VRLLVVYILNVLVGESIVIAIGLGLDRVFRMPAYQHLCRYSFFVFWLSWVLAVRWTEPKRARSAKLAS